MKNLCSGLALLGFTLWAPAASAQVAGAWAVIGNIGSHDFTLDCQFIPHGTQFGGICTETTGGTSGASHALLKGAAIGNQVLWSYGASYMFYKFDINFAGTLQANEITGTVAASGHNGKFTATRQDH